MARKTKKLADQLFPIEQNDDEISIIDISPEQRRLHTETYDFSIATLYNYMKENSIIVPLFQRKYVWNRSQASRLIESLIIQCPIPVIYLNQEKDETLSVIDGNQRLTSIKLFIDNEYELQGLTAYPELEGNKFSDLDPRFRRHIQNRTLRCITILKETHPQIKFDVFERINTGAVQLNPQEVRHGVYHGKLIQLIDELSKESVWKQISGIRNDTRMKGSELILRYFALLHRQNQYKKPLKKFLNEFCQEFHNIDDNKILEWKSTFLNTIKIVNDIFGDRSFKVLDKNLKPQVNSINAALFDAVMVGFTRKPLTRKDIGATKIEKFLKEYQALITTEEFRESITAGTSATNLVKYRINEFEKFIKRYRG